MFTVRHMTGEGVGENEGKMTDDGWWVFDEEDVVDGPFDTKEEAEAARDFIVENPTGLG